MRQNRPEGGGGDEAKRLLGMSRELMTVLRQAQRTFSHETLRLRVEELNQLSETLVEFAEDVHCGVGQWAAYEAYNTEFFGVPLPFTARTPDGIGLERIQHLLWLMYPEFIPGLILCPVHVDLLKMAESAQAFLHGAFAAIPRTSGIRTFLNTPNQYGWDVKRKLIWLGTRSFLFRRAFQRYLAEHNRGRWEIGHVDDFLCQECTRWSGLGAIEILAGVLDLSAEERRDLRSWHERHASFYRVVGVNDDCLHAHNVISDQPYRIRIEMSNHPFREGQLVFGSLVPWRGEWYWSGQQEMWDKSVNMDVAGLRDMMKRQSSTILCRFWKDYERQVRERADELHRATLARWGTDLRVFADGLSMAAAWQQELRADWNSRPVGEVRDAIRRHRLKRDRPDLNIPPDLLQRNGGIGVFLNPEEGQEIMCEFDALVEGLRQRGSDLSEDQEQAIQQFIDSEAISPAFVRRVLAEHGDQSVKAAFRLPNDAPAYWLEYLLRSRKGHFYRNRYPSLSVL